MAHGGRFIFVLNNWQLFFRETLPIHIWLQYCTANIIVSLFSNRFQSDSNNSSHWIFKLLVCCKKKYACTGRPAVRLDFMSYIQYFAIWMGYFRLESKKTNESNQDVCKTLFESRVRFIRIRFLGFFFCHFNRSMLVPVCVCVFFEFNLYILRCFFRLSLFLCIDRRHRMI